MVFVATGRYHNHLPPPIAIFPTSLLKKVISMDFKVGDVVQLVYNCEVKQVGKDSLIVYDKERKMSIELKGHDLINSTKNGSFYSLTKKVSMTEAAEILIGSHGVIFTVEFIKQNSEARTLRGYLVGIDGQFGRSKCVDLDVEEEYKIRLVDHRTIQSIIIGGVKYIVK